MQTKAPLGYRLARGEQGLTIIELIVMMLGIAVLGTIAYASFIGSSGQAHQNVAESNLSTAWRSMATIWQMQGQVITNQSTQLLAQSEPNLNVVEGDEYVSGAINVETVSDDTVIFRTSNDINDLVALKATYGAEASTYRVFRNKDDVETVNNLVPNPSVEASLDSLFVFPSLAYSRTSSWADTGRYSVQMSGTFPVGGIAEASVTTEDIPVEPGKTYAAAAVINVTSAEDPSILTPRIYIRWRSGGSDIDESVAPGDWNATGIQRLTNVAKAPASATAAQVIVLIANGATDAIWGKSLTAHVDSIQLSEVEEDGDPSTYIDGNIPDATWEGASNASPSSGPAWNRWGPDR